MSSPLPCPLPPAASALRWAPFTLSAALAALSTACAFAAVGASVYAGHPMQHAATAIFALFGAGSGAGCAVLQRLLARRSATMPSPAAAPELPAVAPAGAVPAWAPARPAMLVPAPTVASPIQAADAAVAA